MLPPIWRMHNFFLLLLPVVKSLFRVLEKATCMANVGNVWPWKLLTCVFLRGLIIRHGGEAFLRLMCNIFCFARRLNWKPQPPKNSPFIWSPGPPSHGKKNAILNPMPFWIPRQSVPYLKNIREGHASASYGGGQNFSQKGKKIKFLLIISENVKTTFLYMKPWDMQMFWCYVVALYTTTKKLVKVWIPIFCGRLAIEPPMGPPT